MTNVKMELRGSTLLIEIDLEQRHGLSASGKSTCIASTNGGVKLEAEHYKNIRINLNAYAYEKANVPALKIAKRKRIEQWIGTKQEEDHNLKGGNGNGNGREIAWEETASACPF